jgi:hypothetical protein
MLGSGSTRAATKTTMTTVAAAIVRLSQRGKA